MMGLRGGRRIVALAGLLAVLVVPAEAQKLRASLLDDPPIGRTPPDIILPYWANGTPGPADQPFRLKAELGKVVVLAFGGSGQRPGWADVAARVDSMGSPRVELVAVAWGRAEALAGLGGATRLKILADSAGATHRRYGVRATDGWAFFVVADDGRLIWKARRPEVASPGWWAQLVAAARRGAPGLPK